MDIIQPVCGSLPRYLKNLLLTRSHTQISTDQNSLIFQKTCLFCDKKRKKKNVVEDPLGRIMTEEAEVSIREPAFELNEKRRW